MLIPTVFSLFLSQTHIFLIFCTDLARHIHREPDSDCLGCLLHHVLRNEMQRHEQTHQPLHRVHTVHERHGQLDGLLLWSAWYSDLVASPTVLANHAQCDHVLLIRQPVHHQIVFQVLRLVSPSHVYLISRVGDLVSELKDELCVSRE